MRKIKFEELSFEWLSLKQTYLKRSSYVKYEYIIEHHLLPHFKNMSCKKINNQIIYDYFKSLRNDHLSSSTLSTIKFVLSSILDYGTKNYNLSKIDFRQIKITSTKKEKTILSEQDRNKIITYIKSNKTPLAIGMLLALYGGLRLGEICALKWEDVDIKNALIYIKGTAARLKIDKKNDCKTSIVIQTPKSSSSCRQVPLPQFVMKYIKEYSKNKEDDCFVLSNKTKIYEPRRLERQFLLFCRKSDIQSTFHNLRHSYASECVKQNVEIKTLSEILGHSNVSITLNLYVHTSLDQKKKEIKKIKPPKLFVD